MTAYEEGFVKTCAAFGVTPATLMRPLLGAAPAVPKFAPKGPTVGNPAAQTNAVLAQKVPSPFSSPTTAAPAAKTGPRKTTWDEVRRGVRNTPQDPSTAKLTFEPQNFLKNVRGGFRRAFGL